MQNEALKFVKETVTNNKKYLDMNLTWGESQNPTELDLKLKTQQERTLQIWEEVEKLCVDGLAFRALKEKQSVEV